MWFVNFPFFTKKPPSLFSHAVRKSSLHSAFSQLRRTFFVRPLSRVHQVPSYHHSPALPFYSANPYQALDFTLTINYSHSLHQTASNSKRGDSSISHLFHSAATTEPFKLKEKMSHLQGPHLSLFQFESTFRKMLPKGSYMPSHLLVLLNSFEEKLASSLKKLMKTDKDNILSLSWMKLAMESLCETHNDIKGLIVDLELPVTDWDEDWTDVYLNNSMNLLDLCNAFSSEISRLSQGNLLLQCALQNVDSDSTKFVMVHHSLSKWKHHINAKNPRLENCAAILESIIKSLKMPKVKSSAKWKVLFRAIYGFKVKTLFISGIFTSVFTKSSKKLIELRVPETLPWADTFTNLQLLVNMEIRYQFTDKRATPVLKELEAIDTSIINLAGISQPESMESRLSDLRLAAEKFSSTLDLLSTEMDNFFQIVLAGRDTLLCSLRSNYTMSYSPRKSPQAVK